MQTDGEQQRNPSKEGKRKAYYDRVVFIVDPFKAQKEEDDFKDSIAFYYPSPELEDDSKIFLCGQISGTYKIMSNFPGTHPKFVQTQNRGYAVKTLGRRFIIAMHSRTLENPPYTLRLLEELHDFFVFYHHSPEHLLESCNEDWNVLCLLLKRVMPFYMHFVLMRKQSHMSSAFQHIPYFSTTGGKIESSLFLKSSQLLQWCKRSLGIFGGCVLYNDRVICSHLPQNICHKVLILAENEDFLSNLHSALKDDHQLPVGQMFFVYLTKEELSTIENTHTPILPQMYRRLMLSSGLPASDVLSSTRTRRKHRSGSMKKDSPSTDPPPTPLYKVIHATPKGSAVAGMRGPAKQSITVPGMKRDSPVLPTSRKDGKDTAVAGPQFTEVATRISSRPVDIAGHSVHPVHQSPNPSSSMDQSPLSVERQLFVTPVQSVKEGLYVTAVTPVDGKLSRVVDPKAKTGTTKESEVTNGNTSGEDPPFRTPSHSIVGRAGEVAMSSEKLFAEAQQYDRDMSEREPTEGLSGVEPTKGVSGVELTKGVSSVELTKDVSSVEPTKGVSSVEPTEGVSGVKPTEGVSGVEPTEGTSGVEPTEGVSGVKPTEGVSGVEPTEGTSGVEPTEGVSGVQPTEGVSGVEPTEGVSGVEPTEGVSGVEPTKGVSGVQPTEGVSGVEPTEGVSGVEPTEGVSVSESKNVGSSTFSNSIESPNSETPQMPGDDGPQLEQCCIVVLKCLQTSIVLLGNSQLATNIEDIAKMWKEMFTCLNDINATIKMTSAGEDSTSSEKVGGVTISFNSIQARIERCPDETTYFQRQCAKLMHTEFSMDPNLIQCTLTKTHCKMFGQHVGSHEAYLQPEKKLFQKFISGTKVDSALLFHSLPEECAHVLHQQDNKNKYPFL